MNICTKAKEATKSILEDKNTVLDRSGDDTISKKYTDTFFHFNLRMAGKMAQQLRAPAVFPKDQGSIATMHMTVIARIITPVLMMQALPASMVQHAHGAYKYI